MRISLIILLLFSVLALADENEETYKKLEALEKQNKELFAEVKVLVDELIVEEKYSLDDMLLDDDSSVKELRIGLDKAYLIAKGYGLDITRLQKLYEISKKVILRTDFVKSNSLQSISTANSFSQWFDLIGDTHLKIQKEKQKAQEMRVSFYKKVTLQYIKALTQKDPLKAYQEFSKYVDALRTIQSADSEQLIAQAEVLVAEQKLIADLASGLPGIGDAMDIMAVVSGEDMSGEKLSNFERGLNLILILTPEVLDQLIKRKVAIAKTVGMIGAGLENLGDKTLSKISKKYRSKKELKKYLANLNGPSDEVKKWREFYNQKLIEKEKLAALSNEAKQKIAKESEEAISEVFTRKNPLGDDMGSKISDVAKKRNETIITRPTSDDLGERLAEGAYTKGMNVKGKSANSGIASGYVPKNQSFSKLKNKEEIAKFQKKVNESLETEKIVVDGIEHVITPQRVSSKQLVKNKNGIRYEGVEIFEKGKNNSVAVYKRADGKLVDENFEELSEEMLKKFDTKNAKPFEVLTDMDGNYLAADIDLLAIGSKKQETILQNDALMGNINSNEMGTVGDMNKALKSEEFPDRQLVHHGGENNFMNADSKLLPKRDFPLTAYSPDGKVAVIKTEAELKKYFHTQKLKGYDLQPNPYWGWGEYDPLVGYQ
jgi:hypothetical protein